MAHLGPMSSQSGLDAHGYHDGSPDTARHLGPGAAGSDR